MILEEFDEEAMRSVVGCVEGKLGMSAEEWLDETRGQVDPAEEN